jgi:hypothetical protein
MAPGVVQFLPGLHDLEDDACGCSGNGNRTLDGGAVAAAVGANCGIIVMTLPGPSSYRAAVSKAILYVLQHRGMFAEELSGLQDMFHGHWMAYHELAGIDRDESFNFRFATWLWDQKRVPGDAGWAVAIHLSANKSGVDAEKVFEDFVKEFLTTWDAQADGDSDHPSPS